MSHYHTVLLKPLASHVFCFVSGAESTVGAASHAGSVIRSVNFVVRMGGTT